MWRQSKPCELCNDPIAEHLPTGELYRGIVIPSMKLTPTLPRKTLFTSFPEYKYTETLVLFKNPLAAYFKTESEPQLIPFKRCESCSINYLNNSL